MNIKYPSATPTVTLEPPTQATQDEFWLRLFLICGYHDYQPFLPRNPLKCFFAEGDYRERIQECRRQTGITPSRQSDRDYYATVPVGSIVEISHEERDLLHNWATEYGFLSRSGGPSDWICHCVEHDLVLANTEPLNYVLFTGSGSLLPTGPLTGDAPRLQPPGSVPFYLPPPEMTKNGHFKNLQRYETDCVRELRALMRSQPWPKPQQPARLSRSPKKGKVYTEWHYDVLALRFCGVEYCDLPRFVGSRAASSFTRIVSEKSKSLDLKPPK